MPSNQAEWDAKHRLAAEATASEPAGIVRELLPLLPSGPALDIACGTGRNAVFLAGRGQHVTAVDFFRAAFGILSGRAPGMHFPLSHVKSLPDRHRTHRGSDER